MKLLAIDTSNRPLSVAVLEDTQILATTTTNVGRNHSSTLLPIIEQAMAHTYNFYHLVKKPWLKLNWHQLI